MAESHIQSGSRLLQEIVRDQQNDALQYQTLGSARHIDGYVPFKQLAAIFAVLDNQVAKVSQIRWFTILLRSSVSDGFRAVSTRLQVHRV